MKIRISLGRCVLGISTLFLFATGCAELQTGSGGSEGSVYGTSSTSSSAPVSSTDVAAGHYGDTLEACLARIPSDATDSQRMLAELTCQRDEAARQPIKAVPGE